MKAALRNTAAARESHIDGAQPFPTMRDRVATTDSIRNVDAPAMDRGKFDILFACSVSAAFWGVIIFLLSVLL